MTTAMHKAGQAPVSQKVTGMGWENRRGGNWLKVHNSPLLLAMGVLQEKNTATALHIASLLWLWVSLLPLPAQSHRACHTLSASTTASVTATIIMAMSKWDMSKLWRLRMGVSIGFVSNNFGVYATHVSPNNKENGARTHDGLNNEDGKGGVTRTIAFLGVLTANFIPGWCDNEDGATLRIFEHYIDIGNPKPCKVYLARYDHQKIYGHIWLYICLNAIRAEFKPVLVRTSSSGHWLLLISDIISIDVNANIKSEDSGKSSSSELRSISNVTWRRWEKPKVLKKDMTHIQ
ncbi:hypothetical protein BDQ12DRAFT_766623 [Crucibulum laeve]|uniref:Uncharacterized protein n=1 Tax=Crucibulum laeve TaxID=68775 RepID=A0A5C3LNE3_9AGAR|nr:hypothetical protein BDQ12DRAFT_766623 [Crucibulum laeve]